MSDSSDHIQNPIPKEIKSVNDCKHINIYSLIFHCEWWFNIYIVLDNGDVNIIVKQKAIKPTQRISKVKINHDLEPESMENSYSTTPHVNKRKSKGSSKKGRTPSTNKKGRTSSVSSKLNKDNNDKM
jgi:hypothetical protein